jgi:hypothetical protein
MSGKYGDIHGIIKSAIAGPSEVAQYWGEVITGERSLAKDMPILKEELLHVTGIKHRPKDTTPAQPFRQLRAKRGKSKKAPYLKHMGPKSKESLYENIAHYYDKRPGGIEKAIEEAVAYRKKIGPQKGFPGSPEKFEKKIRQEHAISSEDPGSGALGSYMTHLPLLDEKIRIDPSVADRERGQKYQQHVKEHELTHASTLPALSDPEFDSEYLNPIGKPRTEFQKYVNMPAEIDPRLAEIKRVYVHMNPGKKVTSPEDARKAMEFIKRQQTGIRPELNYDTSDAQKDYPGLPYLQRDIQEWEETMDKDTMERLFKRMPSLVRANQGGKSKMASLEKRSEDDGGIDIKKMVGAQAAAGLGIGFGKKYVDESLREAIQSRTNLKKKTGKSVAGAITSAGASALFGLATAIGMSGKKKKDSKDKESEKRAWAAQAVHNMRVASSAAGSASVWAIDGRGYDSLEKTAIDPVTGLTAAAAGMSGVLGGIVAMNHLTAPFMNRKARKILDKIYSGKGLNIKELKFVKNVKSWYVGPQNTGSKVLHGKLDPAYGDLKSIPMDKIKVV